MKEQSTSCFYECPSGLCSSGAGAESAGLSVPESQDCSWLTCKAASSFIGVHGMNSFSVVLIYLSSFLNL